jgi:hypothetical protein
MRSYLYIPISIFLFIFLFDKLFLIPKVRDLFVKNNYNFYDMIFKFEDSFIDLHIKKWKNKNLSENEILEKTLVFIGTSRSEGYRDITENDIRDNPFISSEQQILNKPFLSHFMRAGSYFQVYQLFQYITHKYPTETTFALEINHVGINENLYIRQRKDVENLKWVYFKEIFPELSNRQIVDFISSRLFILNTYSVSFLKPFQGAKDQTPEEMVMGLFLLARQSNKITKDGNTGFSFLGNLETNEDSITIKNYEKFIENFMNTLYLNFEESKTDDSLLEKILVQAKERNLKVIFYRPKIHKLLRKRIDQKFQRQEEEWLENKRTKILEYGFPFIDLEEEGALKCSYFKDPSHLSRTCFPEVIEKFMKFY